MGRKYDFDYIVIGSGPAGSAAALTLAKARKKVGLVEGKFFGGSNLNARDIPYGVALDFAHFYDKIKNYPELSRQNISYNFPTIAAKQLSTVVALGGNDKTIYEKAKISCIKGHANFLDKHTIAVGEQKYTSDGFIIATGAEPKTKEIAGTEAVKFLTPESAIRVRKLPKVVAVVGAGATGCEIAEYFAELGSRVLLFETSERILPKEDTEVGETLSKYLSQKLKTTVITGAKVVALEEDATSKMVFFRLGNGEKMVRVEAVVLATGSAPKVDIGLENAEIKYKNSGIVIDKLFQTSTKNIYAVGDCIGGDSSSDRAQAEGLLVANNLANRTKNSLNYDGLVRMVNTMPEVATVGLNEDDLLKRDRKYKKALVKLSDLTASKIANFDCGFVKIIANKTGHIVGATIVAPSAGLMISELALAVRHNLTALELASTPHSVNSYNYAIKLAAKELLN